MEVSLKVVQPGIADIGSIEETQSAQVRTNSCYWGIQHTDRLKIERVSDANLAFESTSWWLVRRILETRRC
jgi:hypothetical protein